ncbi:hypothetical protein BVRB_5g098190 [Beta vulgaris subsp. vulgaris]|nr:hypothetical protein BVRB_5g098190 [Beta vulgaris subsp. vulgaris]
MDKSAVGVLMTACILACAWAQSQEGIPNCATKLAPCFSYLNGTIKPSIDCCNPLKEVVKTERPCLCSIYNNPALIQTFHINVTQALNLITLCHVDGIKDPNICKATALSPSSSSASTGSTSAPSGTSSGSSTPGNAATKITWAGSAGLASILIVFGAYTMLY